jgi:sterol desaturase/sphingolipid hydroxylase (fatty acid hydroxylase superfamily)
VTVGQFLGVTLGVQLLVLALDLVDRHLTRKERYDGERLQPAAFAFLLAVTVVFLLIQLGGLALVPRLDALIEGLRARVASGQAAAPTPTGGRLILVSVILFHLTGLVDYSWHRWFSHHRWFWFTHESHHLPNQVFVGMPGLGVRPFAVFTVVPTVALSATVTYAALWAVGQPMWNWTVFQIPLLATSTLLVTSHSSFLRRGWLAHRVLSTLALTTPQDHALHHTVDLHGNYGNFTTLWDRLFGTYLDPRLPANQGHKFGLGYDRDFLGTITVGRARIPRAWRKRFQLARYANLDD